MTGEHVARLRADEDRAVCEWRAACIAYDRAVAHEKAALRREREAITRAMRPLTVSHYRRVEQLVADDDHSRLIHTGGGAVAAVKRTLPEVNERREQAERVRERERESVTAALNARADATDQLVVAVARADVATGLTRYRLGRMRAARRSAPQPT